uniref:Transmembrane 9 superfamily member n=1 Tax=Quercus lobata TaxID=97700 RepID=A0A7N2M7A2_QUELO
MARRETTSFLVLILVTLPALVFAIRTLRTEPSRKQDQGYKEGNYIPLLASIAYPNQRGPCEAYLYFDLPFCPPGYPMPNRKKSLQEVTAGDCYVNTGYVLRFKTKTVEKLLCEKTLTREEVAKFRDAVLNETMYELYYDNIGLKVRVGDNRSVDEYGNLQDPNVIGQRIYIFSHLDFHILYLGNKVTAIYVMNYDETVADVSEDTEVNVKFTYSVYWDEFDPNEKLLDETHVLSSVSDLFEPVGGDDPMSYAKNIIIFVWIGLLCIVIVTYLRDYFTRNSFRIHGYRCRCLRYSSLLGAILGVGTQLFIIVCILFILALYTGSLYTCNHERLYTWIITSYVLTSLVSGYKAASFHSSFTRSGWRECVFQTGTLYFVPVFITGLAIITLKAITTGVSLLHDWYNYLWKIIMLPFAFGILTLGGRLGQSSLKESEIACSSINFQSEIHNQAWYMKTLAHEVFFGGLLPFCVIYILMDEIYASLYNLKVCGAISTMFGAFLIVIIQTISVFRGGSVAIFMFAYGPYFYARANARISMNLLEFLGYNACIFYAVFLILGTIGFYHSSTISNH